MRRRSKIVPLLALALSLHAVASAAPDDGIETSSELGPVSAVLRLEPSAPTIGDSLTLILTVTAAPGVAVTMPGLIEENLLESMPISAVVPKQEIDSQGRTVYRHTYTLETTSSGKHHVPPLIVEFLDRRPGERLRPEGEPSYELLTERLDFEVKSVLVENVNAKLRPALGELEPLQAPPPERRHWYVAGVVALLIAAPFGWRWYARWRRLARRRSAHDIALARLERLLAAGLPSRVEAFDPFFVQLSGIVRRYVEDRFEVRAPELTTEEFLEAASRAPNFSQDHQRLLRDFLRGADLVKFAHHIPDQIGMQESVATVRKFLADTRDNAPLLDEDVDGTTPVAPALREVQRV
ncbi:MAG: hypothetical protein ACKVX7_19085 [Planctomycetota bacterium]